MQSNLPLNRSRKAKWVRQDAKIAKWSDEIEKGTLSVREFLLKAQHLTASLQRSQFHLPAPEAESGDYPVRLGPAIHDLEDEQPGKFLP